jgi:hypothetical protein
MEFNYFSARQNDLMRKLPPQPAKTAEPVHPLQQLPQVLGNHAFGTLVSTSIKHFRLWYFNRTNAPMPDAVWEGYANCFAACNGTKTWDPATMELAGRADEFRRDYLGEGAQANPQQDAHNQALGRNFAMRGFEPEQASRAASITPGLLDLSAPVRRYWTPSDGVYAAPASRGGSRLPAMAASSQKRQD